MHLELERRLYTLAIAVLAISAMLVIVGWSNSFITPELFVKLARTVGSGFVVVVAEQIFSQFVAALVCLIPLKLTRRKLGLVDGVLLGLAAAFANILLLVCETPKPWQLLTIATSPVVFIATFWIFRNFRPDSLLDRFYSDQPPWVSISLAALFSIQISLVALFVSSGLSLGAPAFQASVVLALIGAVSALVARIFDRIYLSVGAICVFGINVVLYLAVWSKIGVLFEPLLSCSSDL